MDLGGELIQLAKLICNLTPLHNFNMSRKMNIRLWRPNFWRTECLSRSSIFDEKMDLRTCTCHDIHIRLKSPCLVEDKAHIVYYRPNMF